MGHVNMNTQESTYNGWTNRETWAVMLHLDSDRGLYADYNELYKQIVDLSVDQEKVSDVLTKEQYIVFELEDQLREWINDILHPNYWQEHNLKMPEWAVNMMIDVGSLWRVNWREIADRIIENAILDNIGEEE